MPQCDLVAAQLFGFAVKIPAAHPGTEIARGFLAAVGHLKNVCFKHGDRDMEQSRIALNSLTVNSIVAGIHHKEHQLKGDFAVAMQLLHSCLSSDSLNQHFRLSGADYFKVSFMLRYDKPADQVLHK